MTFRSFLSKGNLKKQLELACSMNGTCENPYVQQCHPTFYEKTRVAGRKAQWKKHWETVSKTCFRVGHVHQNLYTSKHPIQNSSQNRHQDPATWMCSRIPGGLKQGSCWLWSWRRALDFLRMAWGKHNTTIDCYRPEVCSSWERSRQNPCESKQHLIFWTSEHLITSHARLRLYLSLLSEVQIHHDSSMLSWCCCMFCKPHVRLGFLLGSTNSNI